MHDQSRSPKVTDMTRFKISLVTLICTLINVLAAHAQDAKPQAEAAAKAPPSPAVTSNTTTNAATSERNIRFQFEGIPYSEVLERFAQMASKPLVTDTNIQGTLTFNDPKSYNYQEALDTLNVVLSMKGMTLMEDGHYLRLVPFKSLPQMPLRILRGLEHTGDVRPGEIVTVVLEIKNLDTKEVGEAVVSMLSTAGSIAPLSRGRGLIITDRLSNIQRIRSLLAAVDNESVAQRQMKTFTLLHSSGAVVADLINRTFGLITAPKRTQYNPQSKQLDVLPPDPNDYVTAVYDDASRTLVLFGPRDRLTLAQELVAKFEDKEGGAGEVRIYYPQVTKADELAQMIRQAIPGVAGPRETAAAAATKARVISDPDQNRLIVAAPVAGQLDQIELLINKLDKPVHGTGGNVSATRSQTIQVTKVFRPRASEAASVAKILSEALSKRLPSGVIVPTANVTVEPTSQSIVVTGSPGDVQTAVDIITQLETGSNPALPQQTRLLDVGTVAEAKRLLPLVEQIYRSQVTDSIGGQVAHAKIIADAEAGRLIVTASEDHLKRIEEIVRQLRADRAKPQQRRLQIITFKQLRIDAALASINSLVNERMSDRRFESLAKPLLLPDAANNRLLVTASDEQFAEIQDVINTLDIARENIKREMSVVAVQSKSATELINLATQLMAQLGEEQTNPQLAPKLIPDASGKQIIVLATAKDLQRITNLVQQLDGASFSAASRQSKGIELFSRAPAELTPIVRQLYQEQLKGVAEPAGGPATLMEDTKNNRILASGSEKEIARVEAIVRQLDPEGKKGAKEETRVVRLKAGLAADLAGLVEKSLNTQSRQVKVLVDARSNSLVLTGETSAVEAAAQVIQQLDTRSESQPRELRIIELKQGDANAVAPLVNSLFVEMIKDQRGPEYVPQTKILPDAAANRLIVTGPKDELAAVTNVVGQLDQTPEAAGGARVFKLTMADAVTVANVVSNAMLRFDARNQPIRRVSVSPDRESNSVTVSGPRADLQDAQSIIEKLDSEGVEKGRSLKVVDVRTDDPDALAGLAMKVFVAQNIGRAVTNAVSITPEPSGKRLIVLAPPSLLPQVETVLSELDAKPDQGARELQTIELKNATAQELLTMVNRIYSEQTKGKTTKPATIYPDSSGSRLMVYGTKEQAGAIQQIIETLETPKRATRETKVFDLGKLAEAQRILPLAQQLYRDQITNNPGGGPADAQFVSDGRTGRLFVSGRQEQLQQIEQIMARLQVGFTSNQNPRETRAIDVGNPSDVQRLLPLVQQLYQDQWKDKAEVDPADAQIVGDAKTGRLIITGKPDHLKQIEAILNQLSNGKPKADARDTRVYDLMTASAIDLATTVRTLYQDQAKSRLGTIPTDTLILPDASANRLVISGETNEIQIIEGIIKQLDKVSSQSASTRVFKLKSAEPDKVSEILSTALVRYDAMGRPQKRVSVVVDAKSRTLIASGDPKELQSASVIIEQLDSIGAQPERKMKVLPVKSGRSADLSTKLRQLYLDQVKSQPELTVTDALFMDDASSNQIIVAGNEVQMGLIEKILGQLQEHSVTQGPRETKIFEIGQAEEVTRLQTLVQRLYQDQWKSKEASDPPDAVIMPDSRNGRLIVTGKADHIREIEGIIAKVGSPWAAGAERETRVYDLNTTSAGELAVTVRTLYLEQLKARPIAPARQAIILPDAAANRLVVSGTTNELATIDEIVQKLDKVDAQTGRTRVFKLKTAEADQVATMLSTALSQITSTGRNIPRVSVGADKQNNVLIVSGEPKDLQAAAVIVEQMDAVLAKEPRQMHIVPLKSGVASQVATKVKTIYQDQMKGRPQGGIADALIMGDELSNRLIITASESHMKAIEEIVNQLQQTGESVSQQLRVIMLQRNSAASIATMISQLFSRQTGSQDPLERLVVTPSADDRTLVLDAATPTLEKVEQLVKVLDGEEGVGKAEVRTYQIPEGQAAELAPALGRLFTNRVGRVTIGLAPRFEADAAANVLMAVATKDQFVQIDKLIDELQKNARVSSEIRTFKLQHSDPTQISELLLAMLTDNDPLLSGQSGGQFRPRRTQFRPGSGTQPLTDAKSLRVAPAISLNAVIVQGPPDKLTLAENLIQTLDKEEAGGSSVIQTVRLKKANAENVADAVTKTIAARGPQTRLQRVTVTPVIGPNSLLLNGPADAVEDVMKVVRELDLESEDDEIKVHIYRLENGTAKEVSAVIQQFLQNAARGQARSRTSAAASTRSVQATVAVDDRSNSLLISGTAAQFKMVEQLLKSLDKTPERAERDVHLVWLQSAKALDVSLQLDAVFEGRPKADQPVIDPDSFNNSITIIGKRADIVQIQDLIKQLDQSSQDTSLQVRFRPVSRVPVDQMARMLQNIYPQMSAGQIRMSEKIQPPPKQEKPPGSTVPPDTKQPPSSTTPPSENGSKDKAPPPGEVVIAIDKNANALILSGPTTELDRIDEIISDLSYSYISSDAEFRIFALKEADPVMVARTLSDLFKPEPLTPQQQQQLQQQQQQQQQQQSQQQGKPGEGRAISAMPKITVVAEPRTRSVIVRAKATDFTLMESLIKQIDVAGVSSQLEFRLVALTNALPEKIIPLVQQMVTQLNVIRPGEPLTVTPDPRTRGLLVVARDAVLNQIERMIHSLDTPSPFADVEVLVVSLKKASAPQLATVLQGMLRPGGTGQLTPEARELQEQIRRLQIRNDEGKTVLLDLTKPIKIMGDPLGGATGGGNRLIISSTPDNLKALASVVEMMDSVPLIEGVNVKLVHLQHADATTVVQTLTTIFTQGQRLAIGPGGPAQPEGTSGKALVNPLNVAVDARSNTLILSGHQESLDLAQKIINDLDRKLERFVTEVKLFRLKHASATRLAPLLQSVFAEGPAVPGTEGLNTQVTRLRAGFPEERPQVTEQPKSRVALTIQADSTSNFLIVAARTDTLPLIETVINQLDIPSASGLDTIRVYALDHADAVTIQKVINDIFTGPRATQLRMEDRPNVTIDERTRALIVAGNGKGFAIIDSLLAQLDKKLPLDLRDVRIIPLEHADAADVAGTLQQLLDARVTQKASLSKAQADSMRVLVIGEARSNSLLVTGSKDSFELVESLVKELDAAPRALSGRIRLIPLTYADARIVSTSLINLFNQRYQMAKSPEVQRHKPIIVSDPRSNSLLVAAGVDDNQVIDDLLKKLDQKLDDPTMVLTVLSLRHNDAVRVAATLEGVFTARSRARTSPGLPASPQDQVNIESDTLNNALIVSASKENLETLKGLLEKLDVEPVAADGLVQTFTLQFADAQRVSGMLRSLVTQGVYRPGASLAPRGGQSLSQREAMAITVDPRSNTLIVSASPANLLLIKEVIKQVDTKDFADTGNVRLYQLKHAKASSLATVLEQFFRSRRTGGDTSGGNVAERSIPFVVIPDDRTNLLLVTGSKESFDVADRIVQQLDAEDTVARMNFKVFPLKQTTASKLQNTLRTLFVNRPSRIKGETPEPITVVADAWANALIVGASVEDMGMVSSLIERLDSDQAQSGLAVQVLPLAKADARQVAQTVQGLYRAGTPGTGTGTGGGFPVVVTADERLNAIVLSAGDSDMKRIIELVKKLDTDQVARVSEIRVVPLRFARAESLATILTTALNTKPTGLTEQSPNSASLLQFITRTEDGKDVVTSALKEGVLITADARMNSLVISAPADYVGLLEQIISRMDSSSPRQAKIKVFQLVNADARQMAELLTGLFRLQPSGQPAAGQRSIQYTLIKQSTESSDKPEAPVIDTEAATASAVIGSDEQSALHVTVDPRTNSLLVGGTEHYVALVTEIIERLDSSEAQERKSEVYRLKNAQAQEIQTAVRSFLDQERQRITQVLGADAVGAAQHMLEREVAIVAEQVSNTLLLSANPRYFAQVKDLIEKLDRPQPQVLIQVLLAEVTLDSARDLGIEWNVTKTVEDAKLATGTDLGVLNNLRSFGGFSAAVTGSDYNFLLRALENEGRLEVLSRPQILTADNKPATINVGQRVPLITDSRTTQFGDTINSFQYQNVGVMLSVTPRIGADGAVKMEISTTNSALSSSSVDIGSSAKGGTVRVPIINERRATTSVSVQSGQSIIIGGLISTTDDTRTKKVPFFGDIPYLGVLFRSKSKVADRKELLILLTPQVLVNTGNDDSTIMDPKTMTQDQLERSSIKDQFQSDPFRDRLLQPLYPEKRFGVPDTKEKQIPPALQPETQKKKGDSTKL
jgi:type II secretion system protein D